MERPSGIQPLHSEVVNDSRLADTSDDVDYEGDLCGSAALDLLVTVPNSLQVGHRDLVAELDCPVPTDFTAIAKVFYVFVRGIIKFGPCPEPIINRAIDLVLQQ